MFTITFSATLMFSCESKQHAQMASSSTKTAPSSSQDSSKNKPATSDANAPKESSISSNDIIDSNTQTNSTTVNIEVFDNRNNEENNPSGEPTPNYATEIQTSKDRSNDSDTNNEFDASKKKKRGGNPNIGKKSGVSECVKKFGAKSLDVKLTGNNTSKSVNSDESVTVKMAGNQSVLNLNLTSKDDNIDVKGICLFITGDEGIANINVALKVEEVYLVIRGNQAKVNIDVKEGGELASLNANMRGNLGLVKISGEGQYSCNKFKTDIKGNEPKIECD